MKCVLSIAAGLCLLSGLALAQPSSGNGPNNPTTRPPMGQRPVGAKPPGSPPPVGAPSRPGGPPPAAGAPRPPRRPPAAGIPGTPGSPPHHRPHAPRHRPPVKWEKPRAEQWFWRGHWASRLRAAPFIFPRGYSYHHWSVGERLPAAFLAAQFFYDNVAPLGLELPPPGYRWVRYGPDLVLVNLATGDIEEVAYGVFY